MKWHLFQPAHKRASTWHIVDEMGTIVAIVYREAIARQMAQAPQMAAALVEIAEACEETAGWLGSRIIRAKLAAWAALDAAGVEHA